MDTPLPLGTVMDAVAQAIAGARSRLDAAQDADIAAFLEDDGRPRTVSIRPRADSDQIIALPLLALSPPTVLRIVEVSIEFDVDPAELAGVLASGGHASVGGLAVVIEGLGPARARLTFAPSPDAGEKTSPLTGPVGGDVGAPLVDLLSAPLLTAHEVRVRMAKESFEHLLNTNFEPTGDGRALIPRTISITWRDGAAATPVAHQIPTLALVEQEPVGIKDVSVAFVFEVQSVSPPSGLSGVAHPPDAPPSDAAAPLLHIALKAVDTGVAPDVAEQVDRLMDARPQP